jgi:hypothetical protein
VVRLVVALVVLVALPRAVAAEPTCETITATLRADADRARAWDTAWTLIYAGAAVGQGLVAGAATDGLSAANRAGLRVGAVKASIGVVAKVVNPLRIPVPTSCADAPAALRLAARRERISFWFNTLGGLAVNGAGALYLGLHEDSWSAAASSFGVGAAVSVLSAVTMPRRAWRGRYVIVAPTTTGFVLAGSF